MNTMLVVFISLTVVLALVAGYLFIKLSWILANIHLIHDVRPKTDTAQAKALQISNELEEYMVDRNDEVLLFVVDPKIMKLK